MFTVTLTRASSLAPQLALRAPSCVATGSTPFGVPDREGAEIRKNMEWLIYYLLVNEVNGKLTVILVNGKINYVKLMVIY